jgi:hypothetical protein
MHLIFLDQHNIPPDKASSQEYNTNTIIWTIIASVRSDYQFDIVFFQIDQDIKKKKD